MIKRFLLVLVLSTVFILGCSKSTSSGENVPANNYSVPQTGLAENPPTGGTIDAPDFKLRDINGKTVKLSDFKGKYVIVDFWATWCPPCRKGIPDLIALQSKYGNKLQVIGISVDGEETIGDVPGFYSKVGINYPVVYANAEVVNNYGGIESIPTSFVIDKQGKVLNKYIGLIPSSEYEQYVK